MWSSPLVLRGRVFFGSRDGWLYALDAETGRLLYTSPADGYVDSTAAASQDGRSVFIGLSGAKSIGAFDAVSGVRLWTTKLVGLVDSSPVTSPGDGSTIAVGDDNGQAHPPPARAAPTHARLTTSPSRVDQVHLLSAASGEVLWSVRFSMRSYSSPAFAPSGQVVYAGVGGLQGKGQLAALDISHGEPRWKWVVDVAGTVQSSPAATPDGELVIYGSWDSHVYAVRASSGRVAWSHLTGDRVDATARLSPDAATAYIGSWDGCLYALEVATGARRWRAK